MRERIDGEIAAMKGRGVSDQQAHHLMVLAVRAQIVPASWLPKVLTAWEQPKHEEFRSRTAWSLFNAFTEVLKGTSPHSQMGSSLRLAQAVRATILR
jgi:hypothetical protein